MFGQLGQSHVYPFVFPPIAFCLLIHSVGKKGAEMNPPPHLVSQTSAPVGRPIMRENVDKMVGFGCFLGYLSWARSRNISGHPRSMRLLMVVASRLLPSP